MLELTLEEAELFDEKTSRFVRFPARKVRLEHSLLSMSKWESVWEIPFLTQTKKTQEQLLSYIEFMCLDSPPDDLWRMPKTEMEKLNTYISAKHSATWFSDDGETGTSTQTVTSELVYYWMTAFNIPFECENWPFSRLMNLIRIAQIKNADPKKNKGRPRSRMLSERAALNAKRRAEMKTEG